MVTSSCFILYLWLRTVWLCFTWVRGLWIESGNCVPFEHSLTVILTSILLESRSTRQKSIEEVRHWCTGASISFPVHLKSVQWCWGQGSVQYTCVFYSIFGEQCLQRAGTGLGLLIPVKRNCAATAYRDTLCNYVRPASWQQFRKRTRYGCDDQGCTNLWPYTSHTYMSVVILSTDW